MSSLSLNVIICSVICDRVHVFECVYKLCELTGVCLLGFSQMLECIGCTVGCDEMRGGQITRRGHETT